MTRLDPGAFWEFSLAYYSRESVAAACLSLQNRRGADVNILLLCCWLGTLGFKVEEQALKAAIAAVEDWRRDVLEPLRAVRRAAADRFPELAKGDRQSIKHGMLSVELDCERVAQEKIADAASGLIAPVPESNPRDIAGAALESYFGLFIGAPEPQDNDDLAALLEPL